LAQQHLIIILVRGKRVAYQFFLGTIGTFATLYLHLPERV
jgi:hypothetical protein